MPLKTHILDAGKRYHIRASSDVPEFIEIHHESGEVDHILLPLDAFSNFIIAPMDRSAVLHAQHLSVRPKRDLLFSSTTAEGEAVGVFYHARFAAPFHFGGAIYTFERPRRGPARQSLRDNRGMDLGSEALATLQTPGMMEDALPQLLSEELAAVRTGLNVAVVLHLHYVELWREFSLFLQNAPEGFELIVTLTAPNAELEGKIKSDFPGAEIQVVSNLGRDIWPFLKILGSGRLDSADLVCKLHGKRSVMSGVTGGRFGHLWRRRNLFDLMGSKSRVQSIVDCFEQRSAVGMMGSALLRLANGYGEDPGSDVSYAKRRDMAAELVLDPECIKDDFFAGTMFWVRKDALRKLKELNISSEVFTPETDQLGDQVEHAFERFFADCVRGGRYSLADIEPLSLKGTRRAHLSSSSGRLLAPNSLYLAPNASFSSEWLSFSFEPAGKRIALLAVTSPDGAVPPATRSLAKWLQDTGYKVVLCLACSVGPIMPPVDMGGQADAVFIREIGGFDFAIWGGAVRSRPDLWEAEEILFTTDALTLPEKDLEAFIAELRALSADCYAMFGSSDPHPYFSRHLFSLGKRALEHPELRAFFETVLSWNKESECIHRYDQRLQMLLEQVCSLDVKYHQAIEPLRAEIDDPRALTKHRALLAEHGVQSEFSGFYKKQIRFAHCSAALRRLFRVAFVRR